MSIHSFEAKLYICGLSIKDSYEDAILSVRKIEFQHNNIKLQNCICLSYTTTFETLSEPLNQESINSFVITELKRIILLLSLLVNRPWQLVGQTSFIDKNEVDVTFPTRKIPPGLYNFTSMFQLRPNDITKRYTGSVNQRLWETLKQLLTAFSQKIEKTYEHISIALEWIEKGNSEILIGRLVAFWIAFNSLYKDSTKSEQDAITSFLDKNLSTYIAERIIKENKSYLLRLSRIDIELGRGKNKKLINRDFSNSLEFEPQNSVDIIKNMVLTIYGIRNYLFHGNYSPDAEDTELSIGIAEQLLADFLKEIIGNLILENPLPHTKFIFEEKMGF